MKKKISKCLDLDKAEVSSYLYFNLPQDSTGIFKAMKMSFYHTSLSQKAQRLLHLMPRMTEKLICSTAHTRNKSRTCFCKSRCCCCFTHLNIHIFYTKKTKTTTTKTTQINLNLTRMSRKLLQYLQSCQDLQLYLNVSAATMHLPSPWQPEPTADFNLIITSFSQLCSFPHFKIQF